MAVTLSEASEEKWVGQIDVEAIVQSRSGPGVGDPAVGRVLTVTHLSDEAPAADRDTRGPRARFPGLAELPGVTRRPMHACLVLPHACMLGTPPRRGARGATRRLVLRDDAVDQRGTIKPQALHIPEVPGKHT